MKIEDKIIDKLFDLFIIESKKYTKILNLNIQDNFYCFIVETIVSKKELTFPFKFKLTEI